MQGRIRIRSEQMSGSGSDEMVGIRPFIRGYVVIDRMMQFNIWQTFKSSNMNYSFKIYRFPDFEQELHVDWLIGHSLNVNILENTVEPPTFTVLFWFSSADPTDSTSGVKATQKKLLRKEFILVALGIFRKKLLLDF
jgi:hypothetical protein